MAHTLLEPFVFLDTGELRPSSASIPSTCACFRCTFPLTTPTGPGHAKYHTQPRLSTSTGCPTTKLDSWTIHYALDGRNCPDPRLRTLLLRLYNP